MPGKAVVEIHLSDLRGDAVEDEGVWVAGFRVTGPNVHRYIDQEPGEPVERGRP